MNHNDKEDKKLRKTINKILRDSLDMDHATSGSAFGQQLCKDWTSAVPMCRIECVLEMIYPRSVDNWDWIFSLLEAVKTDIRCASHLRFIRGDSAPLASDSSAVLEKLGQPDGDLAFDVGCGLAFAEVLLDEVSEMSASLGNAVRHAFERDDNLQRTHELSDSSDDGSSTSLDVGAEDEEESNE